MKTKKNILLLIILINTYFLFGQKQTITEEKIFFGYFNQIRITNKIGIWSDFHFRTVDQFYKKPFQSFARIGLTTFFTDALRFTAGYCYAYNFSSVNYSNGKIEHRPWQQLLFKNEYKGVQILQYIRLEQRFTKILGIKHQEFENSNRIRFSLMALVPFNKNGITPQKLFVVLHNELFINLGKKIVYNVFDQNRFFLGLGYQINNHNSVHLGYMNLFQQNDKPNSFVDNNCIRLFFYQTLDLRKNNN